MTPHESPERRQGERRVNGWDVSGVMSPNTSAIVRITPDRRGAEQPSEDERDAASEVNRLWALIGPVLSLARAACTDDDCVCKAQIAEAGEIVARLRARLTEPAPSEPVDVVAAVRRDSNGRVWLARRSADGAHAGLRGMWEYPGGKVEPDEQLRAALVRELREEFPGVEPSVRSVLDSINARYGEATYRVTFFEVEMEDPTELVCHTEARWMTPREACSVDHLPSGTIFNARHLASVGEPRETLGLTRIGPGVGDIKLPDFDKLYLLASRAVDALKAREGESIEDWAERLGREVARVEPIPTTGAGE